MWLQSGKVTNIPLSAMSMPVLVEWVEFPQGPFDARLLARERVAQLSSILEETAPATLCVLKALGFIEHVEGGSSGLVFALPPKTPTTRRATTLHELLSRTPRVVAPNPGARRPVSGSEFIYPMPTLSQRLTLASTLSTSIYTFMLTHWHHERFSSLHMSFMLEKPPTRITGTMPAVSPSTTQAYSYPELDLKSPVIGGMAISRPDSTSERSLFAFPGDEELLYLHPDLRNALAAYNASPKAIEVSQADDTSPLPRYTRKNDIYALGLLLAEIGFWGPICRLTRARRPSGVDATASALTPEQLRDAVFGSCSTDLGCWMGEAYRDVTLSCLRAGLPGGLKLRRTRRA
jgi:hypothetical protein